MVLGKLPVLERPINLDLRVGQVPTALAVGAGGGCLDIISLEYHFSLLSPSLLSGEGGEVLVLGNFQCRDVLLIWIIVEQGPLRLQLVWVGCLDIFSLIDHFSSFSISL